MARVAALVLAAAALSGCGRVWLPKAFDARLSEQASKAFGAKVIPNHPWAPFLASAGKALAAVSERPDADYRFSVIASPEINAVSLPDGEVFVTDALIDFAKGDQEAVAAVLGHEIGHVARRHAAETVQTRLGFSAAIGLAFGLGEGGAKSLGGLGASLAELGYDRSMEFEADLCAVRYLARAGYPPRTGLKFLALLAARDGATGKGLEGYFRTHPPTQDRLAYAAAYADKL